MRPVEDMHWYLWEAIQVDINFLHRHNIIPRDILAEAENISRSTIESGYFSKELRERAVAVEKKLEKYQPLYKAALESEYLDQLEEGQEVDHLDTDYMERRNATDLC